MRLKSQFPEMVQNWHPVIDKVLQTDRSAVGVLANPPSEAAANAQILILAGSLPLQTTIESTFSLLFETWIDVFPIFWSAGSTFFVFF